MKLCIFGSRSVSPSPDEIDAAIERAGALGRWFIKGEVKITVLICGMATGADAAGEVWARQRGVRVEPYPIKARINQSKWDFTREAYARNRRMAEACDIALGFWKGQSGGTANMCAHLVALRKPCWLVEVE